MIFYIVLMGIIELSVSRMLIGQEVHFELLCLYLRESSLMEE